MSSHLAASPLHNAAAVRYYSLARHALAAGLTALGVRAGARLLLPEYICRDLLAALQGVGVVPVYYPVDTRLAPALPPEQWPEAAAVLMVDYFGFAQDMVPFERYRARTGALLIEDNAHGFLSRDAAGCWLGRRGDAGLFSLRKTFLFDNGAALVLESGEQRLAPQLVEADASGVASIRMRRALQSLPAGRSLAAGAALALRAVRKWRTGNTIAPPAADAESVIPGVANPCRGLGAMLGACDFPAEALRRRTLYLQLEQRVRALGMTPVFERLPDSTVPYGLPVYCDDPSPLKRLAAALHFDCFRWPDLPDALAARAPSHYRQLHVVNFL